MDMWKTPDFWVAVAVATVVKVRTSGPLSFWQSAMTVMVAIGAAWAGAGWVADRMGLPEAIAAALVALTAEDLMRRTLGFIRSPRELVDLWRDFKK
jgi:hypothetical protein